MIWGKTHYFRKHPYAGDSWIFKKKGWTLFFFQEFVWSSWMDIFFCGEKKVHYVFNTNLIRNICIIWIHVQYVQIHISFKTLTFYVVYQQFQPLTYSNSILFGKDSRCLGPWNSPVQCRVLWVDRQGLPGNMFFVPSSWVEFFPLTGLWFIHFIPSNHHFSGAILNFRGVHLSNHNCVFSF